MIVCGDVLYSVDATMDLGLLLQDGQRLPKTNSNALPILALALMEGVVIVASK